jgi:agmatine deiminase
MSCRLAQGFNAQCHTTNLILDGGNYMTDGKGGVFLTSRVYDWNRSMSREQVDSLLKQYLQAETIHVLDYAKSPNGEPADGTGHIDMFAKLLGECKVMVAETNDEPYKTATEKAAMYFSELGCGEGKYEVYRSRAWDDRGTWYTYTNSLIVNNTVIIPHYDNGDNAAAGAAYKAALPDYEIVGVNSESTIGMGGSIHCVTKEIPAFPL